MHWIGANPRSESAISLLAAHNDSPTSSAAPEFLFGRNNAEYPLAVQGIRNALRASGLEFINENGGGPGKRLRKQQHKKG